MSWGLGGSGPELDSGSRYSLTSPLSTEVIHFPCSPIPSPVNTAPDAVGHPWCQGILLVQAHFAAW